MHSNPRTSFCLELGGTRRDARTHRPEHHFGKRILGLPAPSPRLPAPGAGRCPRPAVRETGVR